MDLHTLRRLGPGDLERLVALEEACYDAARRSSRASLRRSLSSPVQEVWALGDDAVLILWCRPATWRVYGIHTHPHAQGQGLAGRLLAFAEGRARASGACRMVLEADAHDSRLRAWYEKRGYKTTHVKPGFYGPDRPAVRMQKRLEHPSAGPAVGRADDAPAKG